MKSMHARTGAWSSLLGLSALALAADVNLEPGKSSLIVTFRQENAPVDAPFKKFSGRIDYDPAKPAGASAAIDVDIALAMHSGTTYSTTRWSCAFSS